MVDDSENQKTFWDNDDEARALSVQRAHSELSPELFKRKTFKESNELSRE
jgi:hypothetical protein